MTRPRALMIALALAATAGILGPWLDGQPSETDVARAVAADAQAAPKDWARQQRRERAEAQMQRQERPCVPTAPLGIRAAWRQAGRVL
ncbi:MAG: hypothetical protein LBI48_13135 [Burkholderiaceae bacterium]|jgi:hypothetical protein|nr:hypothetical protein [Burkholderiaceae bacterium]